MINLMLDSGAFSAWSKGVEINIDEYIAFVKDNLKFIKHYVCLDVIGDAEKSYANQKYMEKKGLKPIPVFHTTFEDPFWLKKYIDEGNDYIGLGGMAGGTVQKRNIMKVLDNLFFNYICDRKGFPKVKIHGFGLTSLDLMLRYPWYSVDSTSWVMTSRFGSVYVPQKKQGRWIYDQNSWKVGVSNRSPSNKEEGKHITTFSPMERKIIDEYFGIKGFKLGKSEFRKEEKGYKLKEGERWFGKEEADSQRGVKGDRSGYVNVGWTGDRQVEIIIEPGLCNDYKQRDEMNIIYFLDLEKSMPEWPWPFKLQSQKGFGLK